MVSGLESAKLKIIRAAEHLETLESCILAYSSGNPYVVSEQPDRKGTVKGTEAPPPLISVLSGEVVYQLRSAIDHLVFELVKLNPRNVVLPDKWDERCNFPLKLTAPCAHPPCPYKPFANDLPGITDNAFTFIEACQPYNRKPRASVPNVLWLLAELSNIDKHRHLNVIRARFSQTDATRWQSSTKAVDDGAELEPLILDDSGTMNVKRSIDAFVTFKENRLGPARNLAVEHILHLCQDVVASTIVPAFEKFLENP